jgi:N-acetyl-anhydromuramyl-L-alanine amidase AmpD
MLNAMPALGLASAEAQLRQLSEQQAAITRALAAMAEGRWTGEDSVEAWLIALNPTFQGKLTPRLPLRERRPPTIAAPRLTAVQSPNFWTGHGGYAVGAIVVHTMAGSLASCDRWFANPDSQVSAHFGIGLNGEQHQYVSLTDSAWANGIREAGNTWPLGPGNPNYQTISIETEDNGSGGTPVSDAQFNATLEVANLALGRYPTIQWLLRHTDISPLSRPSCCGGRWVDSGRFAALANQLGLKTTI